MPKKSRPSLRRPPPPAVRLCTTHIIQHTHNQTPQTNVNKRLQLPTRTRNCARDREHVSARNLHCYHARAHGAIPPTQFSSHSGRKPAHTQAWRVVARMGKKGNRDARTETRANHCRARCPSNRTHKTTYAVFMLHINYIRVQLNAALGRYAYGWICNYFKCESHATPIAVGIRVNGGASLCRASSTHTSCVYCVVV